MPLHVPGLKPDSQIVKPDRWYLLKVAGEKNEEPKPLLRDVSGAKPRLEVTLVIDEGEFKGEKLSDSFYLTSKKSKQRLWHFLSRAGYPKELLEEEMVDEKKIIGLRLWALVILDDYGGIPTLKTQWKFRSVAEGKPQDEEGVGVVDYGKEEPDELSEAL